VITSTGSDPPLMLSNPLYNHFNWVAAFRACWVFTDPLPVFIGLLCQNAPTTVRVRTPIGKIKLKLRNFESLRTLFSIFCRQDYLVSAKTPSRFLDIGANIGLASVYFLSRNADNIVHCFEPDLANLAYLRENLAAFRRRATISDHAVHVSSGASVLYRSPDGKHSSLHRTERASIPQQTVTRMFDDILAEIALGGLPTIIKLDVEGTEGDLVQSVRFENYPCIQRIIIEGTSYAQFISRPHTLTLRNGYIEDLTFIM
jgi:FkbM family methyltransferase